MGNSIIEFIVKNLNIFIPVGATLFVFFVGAIFKWISKKNDKRIKLKSTKKIVEIWCRSIEPTYLKQIEECRDLIKIINNIDKIQDLNSTGYDLLLDRINMIDFKEFGETFVLNLKGNKNENVKLLFKLITYINFLSNFSSTLNKYNEVFNKSTIRFMEDWNKSFRDFLNLESKYTQLIGSGNYEHPSQEFYNDFILLKNKWETDNPEISSLKSIIINLINPVYVLCLKYKTNNKEDQMTFELKPILDELLLVNLQWDNLKKGYIRYLESYIEEGESSYDNLQKTIEIYEKKKMKNLVFIK